MHPRIAERVPCFCVPLAALWCASCAPIDNDRLTVGGVAAAPALTADGTVDAPLTPAEGPSLTSVSRGDWPAETIAVPIDPVEHHPAYTAPQPRYSRSTLRQRGGYPTEQSVADLGADANAQVWEMLAGPVWGAMDIVLFIPRAIGEGPGATTRSPSGTMHTRYPGAPAPSASAEAPGSPVTP